MCEEKIYVNIRINFVTRLLAFSADEIKKPEILVAKIFQVFEITSEQCVDLKFQDNLKAPVDANDMGDLIMQKKSSGSFFIELVLDGSVLSFRAESIKNYIEAKFPSHEIFGEIELLNGVMSTKTQKLVTDALYCYIVETFSNDPSPKDVIECCKAAVKVFPCLEATPSVMEGIDLLYNPTMKRGTIFHKLRNNKTVTKPKDSKANKNTIKELKATLKYCVVKKDKKKLKEILLETISIRRQLLKEEDNDFKEFWNFYFVDTELILYDFHLLFGNIDENALATQWDDLHNKPLSSFSEIVDTKKVQTTNVKVWQIITTFMSLKPRGNFWKALSFLIIFSANPQVDPSSLQNGNQKPYIIGIISADKTTLKFYISIRGVLISVPNDIDIVGTLDILYKLYKIFNVEPVPQTKVLIDFLDYFIYGNEDISNAKITKEMHELGDKFKNISI